MRRWLLIGVMAVLGLVAVGLAAGLALPFVELGGFAAGRLAARLGRAVQVESLRVSPGRWLLVRLRGASVDNLAGGSRPRMLGVATLEAEVDALSLVAGPMRLRRLRVAGLDVLLEHVGAENTPNWHFGAARAPGGGVDYSWLPTMLDAAFEGQVVVRTMTGTVLTTQFAPLRVTGTAAAAAARVEASGAYRGVPLTLDATLASFDAVRAAPAPSAVTLKLASGTTTLEFKGTMRAPLDVDGAQGELTLEAPDLVAIAGLAGMDPLPFPPSRAVGTLDRDGTRWSLANTTGALGASVVRGGDVVLEEGRPDRVALALDFDRLDLEELLKAQGGGASDMPILLSRQPATVLDAKLSAASLAYAGLRFTDASLDAALEPGAVRVEGLGFGYLGGEVKASGRIETAEGAAQSHVAGGVDVTALDVQAVRRAFNLGAVPVTGRLSGRVHLEADGAALNQALRGARISAVVGMQGGSVSRELIELASTDARTLFRSASGAVALVCGVGIVDIRAGVGTVSPLRLRSAEGTVAGRGRFDLVRRSLDLTVASEARTTGLFALDIPVRITGSFDDPQVAPARLSAQGRAQLTAGDAVGRLLPGLREYARQSACLERAR